jgi:hypothetical protein
MIVSREIFIPVPCVQQSASSTFKHNQKLTLVVSFIYSQSHTHARSHTAHIASSRWQWAALPQYFMVLKECHAQELIETKPIGEEDREW